MYEKDFVTMCLEGLAIPSDIDNYVEEWHNGEYDCSLQKFLGFSDQEYTLWLVKPTKIQEIIQNRKNI